MATRVFNLRNVPDDEAEEVRQLLETHQIEFYETPAGSWGMSMPSLWVPDDSVADRAKSLIADYQEQRAITARQIYEAEKASGQQRTFWMILSEGPGRFLFYILLILFFLYLSIMPFLKFGE